LLYIGNSMRPTFRHLDRLQIKPYRQNDARVGDVVVFTRSAQQERIVHRVISITPAGLRTQGDNLDRPDPYVVTDKELQGRVVSVRRGSKYINVQGGTFGYIIASLCRIRKSVIHNVLYRPIRFLFDRINRSGMIYRLIPLQQLTRVLVLPKKEGTELKLLLGRHPIGWLQSGADDWIIRPSFRLFIDVSNLPDANDSLPESVRHIVVKVRSGFDGSRAY